MAQNATIAAADAPCGRWSTPSTPGSARSCSSTSCASAPHRPRSTRRRPPRTCSTTRPSSCVDGRSLERPVNYALTRIVPSEGVDIDPLKRPFVVVDPRAGPRSGHRRLQGRQRDRRGDEGRPPLLFRRLPARSRARPDHRGHRPRGGGVPGDGHRPASGRRGQALRHRQLPGRLGDDDGERAAPGAVRPDHHRGLAALLLGRRARQEPDALLGRPARRLAG